MAGSDRSGRGLALSTLIVLGALVAVLLWPRGATAATPAQAIANLNTQRAANGIPAGITERPQASQDCALHNDYERQNGGELTHQEDPNKPGYTADGADAGAHSVLASGENWNTTNPWETAPIHLAQLLDPYLASIGVDDSQGFVCATTLPDETTGREAVFRSPFPAITGYSYPGNGTSGWPTTETAAEGPFTPGDLVGLPQPATTGPYLYVLFAGPWPGFGGVFVTISSATLTGPHGAVPVKTADGNTSTGTAIPLGDYIGSSAMVIPTVALQAGTTYTAQVNGSVNYNGTQPVSERFSFTTAGTPQGGGTPPPKTTGTGSSPSTSKSRLRLSKGHRHHGVLTFTLTATGAYRGRRARVTVKTGGRIVRSSKSKLRGRTTIGIADVRHATVVVTVKAFTSDGVHYAKKTLKRSA